MNKNILLIDDEIGFRKLLARLLELEDYQVDQANNIQEGIDLLRKQNKSYYAVVLCDVRMPDGYGFEVLEYINNHNFVTEFILMTAYGTIADGVKAIKMGAFDYLTKTDDKDRLLITVAQGVEKSRLRNKIAWLEKQNTHLITFDRIIGKGEALQKAIALAKKVSYTDTPILINGETGTGKELFAQAIHSESNRKDQPFVPLNCSAIPAELLESELFGYHKGAFTGANADKKGLIEEANGGTLFLDEIGEMSLAIQAKLLRVIETQTFTKLGTTKQSKVNVRIVSATHRNLLSESEQGHFRSDLYYRLSVFRLVLPSLRDRVEDIALLAGYFTEYFCLKTKKKPINLTPDFIHSLELYPWKGNVRELKNVIERAVILCDTDELSTDLLPPEFHTILGNEVNNDYSLAYAEKEHILKVLQHTQGNKNEAARLLQIGLATLYRKLQETQFA